MFLKIICAALLCLPFEDAMVEGKSRIDREDVEYVGQQYIDQLEGGDDNEEDDTEDVDPIRIKGFKSKPSGNTSSPQEISVRGAIKGMLLGNENLFTPITINVKYVKKSIPDKRAIEEQNERKTKPWYENYPVIVRTKVDDVIEQKDDIQTDILTTATATTTLVSTATNVEIMTENDSSTAEPPDEENDQSDVDNETVNTFPSRPSLPSTLKFDETQSVAIEPESVKEAVTREEASSDYRTPTRTTSAVTIIEQTTSTTTSQTTKLQRPKLLEMIANLINDYQMNATENLKETLPKLSTEKLSLKFIDDNATETIVAKCYVCGLEEEGIPAQAHCADAFAGDFLPLTPVDTTARGNVSGYRKYCRYRDVNNYKVNASTPRSVYGRWSGGCAVRWLDASGVYTQRACRGAHAVVGRHRASRRMAKLEMALKKIDNGCISSPMATLVPLSRGISLYARFHACVCTGNWCNTASRILSIGTLLLIYVSFIICNTLN